MVELSPEIKAQLEEQKKNCVFCKIISGEIEGKTVYSDDELHMILDIRPAAKGHLLVMPKEHYPIMPLLPPKTFTHLFGMIPQIVDVQKQAMIMTGANICIANGAVAGQQSPHFLYHVIGRDNQDGNRQFAFQPKTINQEAQQKAIGLIRNNLPIMMANHFKRNPASWHHRKGGRPDALADKDALYEDEKTLVAASPNHQSTGHLELYSKEEAHEIENMSYESASHLLYVASFAATACFEGLGAQGTNIIIKTGSATDNPEGKLCVHIIPRWQDDGLDLMPHPGNPGDTKDILASYSDHTFKMGKPKETPAENTKKTDEKKEKDPLEEIRQAIRRLP